MPLAKYGVLYFVVSAKPSFEVSKANTVEHFARYCSVQALDMEVQGLMTELQNIPWWKFKAKGQAELELKQLLQARRREVQKLAAVGQGQGRKIKDSMDV